MELANIDLPGNSSRKERQDLLSLYLSLMLIHIGSEDNDWWPT
jgi:hypothetical protein